jgi:hypothetical protein
MSRERATEGRGKFSLILFPHLLLYHELVQVVETVRQLQVSFSLKLEGRKLQHGEWMMMTTKRTCEVGQVDSHPRQGDSPLGTLGRVLDRGRAPVEVVFHHGSSVHDGKEEEGATGAVVDLDRVVRLVGDEGAYRVGVFGDGRPCTLAQHHSPSLHQVCQTHNKEVVEVVVDEGSSLRNKQEQVPPSLESGGIR